VGTPNCYPDAEGDWRAVVLAAIQERIGIRSADLPRAADFYSRLYGTEVASAASKFSAYSHPPLGHPSRIACRIECLGRLSKSGGCH